MSHPVEECLLTSIREHKTAQNDHIPLRRTITEDHSPKFRRLTGLKQLAPLSFQDEHRKLLNEIDLLEGMVNERMNIHEHELLNIMRQEITRILGDVKKIIKVYNSMVLEKNLNEELQNAHNQAEYFKHEAVRLFEENRVLKIQISMLKHECDESKIVDRTNLEVIKKLAYKAAKNKSRGKSSDHHQVSKSLRKMPETEPDSAESPNQSRLKPTLTKEQKAFIHNSVKQIPDLKLLSEIHTEKMPDQYQTIESNRNFITQQLASLINNDSPHKHPNQKSSNLQKRKINHMKQRILDKNKQLQNIKNCTQNHAILRLIHKQ